MASLGLRQADDARALIGRQAMKRRTLHLAASWIPIYGALAIAVIVVIFASELAENSIACWASEREE